MPAQNNRPIRINRKDSMNTPAAQIRDSFTFKVETDEGFTRTFIPSVLHIGENGQQTVASTSEARPLTDEHNFFMEFERRPDEQIFLVNFPINELTVEEISKITRKQWAARFHDEEKVSFLFICKKDEDGWNFRRATERIYITTDGNGNKRAKMAAHRSLAGGILDADEVDIHVDPSMHDVDRCRRDGTMVGSFDLAEKIGHSLSSGMRVNIRIAGNDGRPFHGKGDIIFSEKVRGGHDILTCPCNIKRDGGLMVADKLVIGTTGPQHQGESVQSNPQVDASAGHVFLDRPMYDNSGLTVWEHQLQAKMGKTLSRVLLGKNPHFAGLDPEDQKLDRRASVAGFIERELGDAFISPAVTLSNIEAAEAMYSSKSKHRVPVPGAFSYSLTAPEILDDMMFDGPRPNEGEIAIYSFGFVPHEDIFFDIADTGGGADGDDHFSFFPGFAAEAFAEYEKNELLADLVRFPQGARIHEGKVGVEHSLVRISDRTSEFNDIFRRAHHLFPVLDFHLLPESTSHLPVPQVDEVPGEDENLSFMDEVERLAQLRGSYGRFSLRVTSLVYLATNFFDGELPPVVGEDGEECTYTLPMSMEAAIDSTAKTPSLAGMTLVEKTAADMTDYIIRVIMQHLDGKVDRLFAARTGLLDADGELLSGLSEAQWSMSRREEQWVDSYERLCKFTDFMADRYKEAFTNAATAMGGYSKDAVTERFWALMDNSNKAASVIRIANRLAESHQPTSVLQNLQLMQTMDIMADRKGYVVSETLFSLPLVEQTVAAVDSDLHQHILAGMMDRVWTPMLNKIATSYDGEYRNDPFIGQVVSGFDRYYGGGFSDMHDMIQKAEEDSEFLVACMERAANEAAELEDEYNDDDNIVLCLAETTRGTECQNRAVSCPHH